MPAPSSIPLPATHALRKLGRDFALARRKRGIPTEDMAARLFVSRATLWRMERGDPTMAIGTVATAALCSSCLIGWRIWPRRMRWRSAWTNAACRNASAAPKHEHRSAHRMGGRNPAGRAAAHGGAPCRRDLRIRPEWLRRVDTFSVDPTALPLRPGPQHSPALFGAMQDCGPDRWGRLLIERAVRKHILDRKPYQDLDYVLALDDFTRIGALRFRKTAEEPFLAAHAGKIPPLVQLAALLNAANAVHWASDTARDLRFLLGEGSPLGGARPKSAVALPDGRLAIAKFPKPDDARDIGAGEILALALARRAGIRVADHQFVEVRGQRVAVITRFDREDGHRIPFLSANSLLALPQGEAGAYTLLADGVRQFGCNAVADLRELWRRLVFSLLISNYDDHLRNHGFLMRGPGRWTLSPAYDLNPVPEIDRGRAPQTPISEDQEEPSIGAALEAASRFGLKSGEAKIILHEVVAVVGTWRQLGRQLRLQASTLEAYATAFENPLINDARHS